jgi:hypothetical protein
MNTGRPLGSNVPRTLYLARDYRFLVRRGFRNSYVITAGFPFPKADPQFGA